MSCFQDPHFKHEAQRADEFGRRDHSESVRRKQNPGLRHLSLDDFSPDHAALRSSFPPASSSSSFC